MPPDRRVNLVLREMIATLQVLPPTPPGTVCSWCGLLLRDGPSPLSHGMCEACQVGLWTPTGRNAPCR